MLHQIRILLFPLRYLKIYHEDKYWFDWVFPLVLTSIVLLVHFSIPSGLSLAGGDGLVKALNPLIQVLTGFYVAALAVIATFQNSDIDKLMKGDPPEVFEPRGAEDVSVKLTRRRFLSYMFGYLAFVSFVLYGMGVVILMSAGYVTHIPPSSLYWGKTIGIGLFSFAFFNLVITTLLGLYYLTYKIHLKDSVIVTRGHDDKEG